jgi:Protein of unknown function (DUF3631)
MTRHHSIVRHFGERQRERLMSLFRALGTHNIHEREAARGHIDALLREHGKTWGDLIELLGGNPAVIDADIACNIAALGAGDVDTRDDARRTIDDLLACHRQNWNDLADALSDSAPAAWATNPGRGDPPRVNPLALVHHLLGEYVALQPHEYVAVALWVLHTHVFDRFMVTPRLALRSPVADCGKTTLLDILARLVARPEKFDAITTAALFRLIDQGRPTLLIDEADNLGLALQPNGRLRAVFNSGHRQGGTIAISERSATRKYTTFAPLALALPDMRGLPRTLNSRSISLALERSQRKLKRFDALHPDFALDAAYDHILLWRRDVELNPDPELPAGLRNRFADNWRPLIAIADSLGWGEQAREAMIAFAREHQDADAKILLLSDIRRVFDAHNVNRIASKVLLAALHVLDEAEWCEFRGTRGDQQPHKLKDTELANMLRDFAIRPRSIWPSHRTPTTKATKGYRRAWFEDAWRRYCGDDGTASHTNNIRSSRAAGDGTA